MPPTSISANGQFVRAAQYMRMSREHQRFSLENQAAANCAYALEQGYEIVRSYVDAGVSGLQFETRDGLKSLLADVVGGRADFAAVIVYDVSRWGRFQDPDEGAHYEFLCRSAGVPVVYSTEPFAGDDSLMSVLAKSLKRAMAAEYSRELSAKVARAQRAASAQGYWRGSACGYGFRRCVIDPGGVARLVLQRYERKAIQGHRVRLVAGPPHEVATVRRIYNLFVVGGLSVLAISQLLNAERDPAEIAWSSFRVRRILEDEKYVGVLVYGKHTCHLKRVTPHPRDRWIRVVDACPALVPRALFDVAQANLRHSRPSAPDNVLINELKALLATHGRLSNTIIQTDERAHCPAVYIARFGGLLAAYRLAGYEPSVKQRAAAAKIYVHKPYLARPHMQQRSDDEMLEDLRELHRTAGYLNARLIQDAPGTMSQGAYRNRFGGMRAIYDLVGYEPNPRQVRALSVHSRRAPRRPEERP